MPAATTAPRASPSAPRNDVVESWASDAPRTPVSRTSESRRPASASRSVSPEIPAVTISGDGARAIDRGPHDVGELGEQRLVRVDAAEDDILPLARSCEADLHARLARVDREHTC